VILSYLTSAYNNFITLIMVLSVSKTKTQNYSERYSYIRSKQNKVELKILKTNLTLRDKHPRTKCNNFFFV